MAKTTAPYLKCTEMAKTALSKHRSQLVTLQLFMLNNSFMNKTHKLKIFKNCSSTRHLKEKVKQ